MACGSVVQGGTLVRDIPPRGRPSSSGSGSPSEQKVESPANKKSLYRGPDVHHAIAFLQKEHEKVLSGLHRQMEVLQQKCDDMQFSAHLRHVTTRTDETLRRNLAEMTSRAETYQHLYEEDKQQHEWQLLQLRQQVEVSEQKCEALKSEVALLKSRLRDLKIYSSATSSGLHRRTSASSHGATSSLRMSPSALGSSQESLEASGPLSLGSENGDGGVFRYSRLGSVTPTGGGSRPSSGAVTLPPISNSQAITRPQVRQQLRLFSAPILAPIKHSPPKKPPP